MRLLKLSKALPLLLLATLVGTAMVAQVRPRLTGQQSPPNVSCWNGTTYVDLPACSINGSFITSMSQGGAGYLNGKYVCGNLDNSNCCINGTMVNSDPNAYIGCSYDMCYTPDGKTPIPLGNGSKGNGVCMSTNEARCKSLPVCKIKLETMNSMPSSDREYDRSCGTPDAYPCCVGTEATAMLVEQYSGIPTWNCQSSPTYGCYTSDGKLVGNGIEGQGICKTECSTLQPCRTVDGVIPSGFTVNVGESCKITNTKCCLMNASVITDPMLSCNYGFCDMDSGICRDPSASYCGDGTTDPGEECDAGPGMNIESVTTFSQSDYSLIDRMANATCMNTNNSCKKPACTDGKDNDGDGKKDAEDPSCYDCVTCRMHDLANASNPNYAPSAKYLMGFDSEVHPCDPIAFKETFFGRIFGWLIASAPLPCAPKVCPAGQESIENSYMENGVKIWLGTNSPTDPYTCVDSAAYCCFAKYTGAYSIDDHCLKATQQYSYDYNNSSKTFAGVTKSYVKYGFQMCEGKTMTYDPSCEDMCPYSCPLTDGISLKVLPVCRVIKNTIVNGSVVQVTSDESPAVYSGRSGPCEGLSCRGELIDGVAQSCSIGKFINCARCELATDPFVPPSDPKNLKPDELSIEEFKGCICNNPNDYNCGATFCEKNANGVYAGDCDRPCSGVPPERLDCYVLYDGKRVKRDLFTANLECRDFDSGAVCMPPTPGGPYGGAAGGPLGGGPGGVAGGVQGGGISSSAGAAGGTGAAGATGDTGGCKGCNASVTSQQFSVPSVPSAGSQSSDQSQGSVGSSASGGSANSGSHASESSGQHGVGHLACVNGACVLLPQAGQNTCDQILGCGTEVHAICLENSCMQAQGPGANECSSSIECGTHTECQNNACVSVIGSGENACASIADCLKSSSSSAHSGSQDSSLTLSSASSSVFSSVTVTSSSSLSSHSIIIDSSSSASSRSSSSFSSSSSSVSLSFSSSSSSSTRISSSSLSILIGLQSSSSFTLLPIDPLLCGNGILNFGETCDDGNDIAGDGCSPLCTREDGELTPIDPKLCGNGILDFAETCDDGNSNIDDGCSPSCTVEFQSRSSQTLVAAASLCGNGLLESPEECDDSNRRSSDGCSDSCLLEIGICGDGIVQQLLGEQCEQSTHDPSLPYLCRSCRFFSTSCGDGKFDPGEECDKGVLNSTSKDADCRPDCSLSRCGDSVLDSTELCDDGNRRSGDGCDMYCRKETTLVASDQTEESKNQIPNTNNPITNNPFTVPFPYAQPQQYQLPFASLQPLIQQVPTTTQSGPAAVVAIGAGAAAGWSWVRRRK